MAFNIKVELQSIFIVTDIMVELPGETDVAFRASCDLLLNSPVSYADILHSRNAPALWLIWTNTLMVKKHRRFKT